MKRILFLLALGPFLLAGCTSNQPTTPWQIGPFIKQDAANPILTALDSTAFFCPVRMDSVYWEAKDVFNPTALVRNGKVHLLYRAEDKVGKYAGTSRIGLAVSDDGIHFERMPAPIFYPENDDQSKYEWEGGCEDPRIVESEDGTYFMTYTAYDGEIARLLVASSKDLVSWTKYGPVFQSAENGKFLDLWSKSGAVVTKRDGDKFVATKINGKYWMYWGDTNIYLAWSDDLINWTPVADEAAGVTDYKLKPIFGPRPGKFDSDLVEPGPQAFVTEQGILLIYNSRNYGENRTADLADGTYSAGQILFDINDPSKVVSRSDDYFMTPDKDYEITGQVNNVCFLEGLVNFKGKWYLYYGTADSKIAVAVSE
ncbi:MAG: glycoside hydrolase family 130 protein [Imperialibacter sp.]|uniref:glycoside hydrolase family 130 protein n=1 Tax=Imperialibacter sp. TaxID=2038411 RepID=UPI0032EB83F8